MFHVKQNVSRETNLTEDYKMLNLRDRAKQLENSLPFMEGREKGEMKRIIGMNVTIREFGFLEDAKKKTDYVCFIVDEDPQNFYFGGQVLTEDMKELEKDGYTEAIKTEGLPVLFGLRTSKDKNEYVTVSFYPENDLPFDKKETAKK